MDKNRNVNINVNNITLNNISESLNGCLSKDDRKDMNIYEDVNLPD